LNASMGGGRRTSGRAGFGSSKWGHFGGPDPRSDGRTLGTARRFMNHDLNCARMSYVGMRWALALDHRHQTWDRLLNRNRRCRAPAGASWHLRLYTDWFSSPRAPRNFQLGPKDELPRCADAARGSYAGRPPRRRLARGGAIGHPRVDAGVHQLPARALLVHVPVRRGLWPAERRRAHRASALQPNVFSPHGASG
jgi:hypothetical protein